MSKAIGLACLA